MLLILLISNLTWNVRSASSLSGLIQLGRASDPMTSVNSAGLVRLLIVMIAQMNLPNAPSVWVTMATYPSSLEKQTKPTKT